MLEFCMRKRLCMIYIAKVTENSERNYLENKELTLENYLTISLTYILYYLHLQYKEY
jgi:hypothetical protein